LTVAAPKAVDLTRYVSVRDVGQEGTVAAAACATAMDASLAAQGRPTRVSMRYIYEKAKRHDEVTGEGTFLETMIYVARQFGAPPETLWPYKSLSRKLPVGVTWNDLDQAAAPFKARLTQLTGLDAILGALDKQSPVLSAAIATDAWGDVGTSAQIRPPGAGEQTLGATVITIVAYDPATRRFKFANNWGPDWGDMGFGYFDASDAEAILQLDTGLWSVTVPAASP
jgi:C1A family cysteine protease